MTPEQKAKDLVYKFIEPTMYWDEIERESLANTDAAKQCAIIAVDEILESWGKYNGSIDLDLYPTEVFFWLKVKEEINKL